MVDPKVNCSIGLNPRLWDDFQKTGARPYYYLDYAEYNELCISGAERSYLTGNPLVHTFITILSTATCIMNLVGAVKLV